MRVAKLTAMWQWHGKMAIVEQYMSYAGKVNNYAKPEAKVEKSNST